MPLGEFRLYRICRDDSRPAFNKIRGGAFPAGAAVNASTYTELIAALSERAPRYETYKWFGVEAPDAPLEDLVKCLALSGLLPEKESYMLMNAEGADDFALLAQLSEAPANLTFVELVSDRNLFQIQRMLWQGTAVIIALQRDPTADM